MKSDGSLGSLFDNLPEPEETYREGCFAFQKWTFETNSQDVKWFVMRREFLTLSEQAKEWIERFNFLESIKLDAKRLIWNIKYNDYKNKGFGSPLVIALCSLKVVCDLKNIDFFSKYDDCVVVMRENMKGRKLVMQKNISYDSSTKERIRAKSKQMLELIGPERIENLKRMWGCIDEAVLLA